MINELETNPGTVRRAVAEDYPHGIDMTAQLSGAQTITLPSASLFTGTGTPVVLADAPSVDGNVIRQRIRANVLSPGLYRLVVRFTPSGTTNVLQTTLNISCST